MEASITAKSALLGRPIHAFTPQSESGGKHRAGILNPYLEHKKFFDSVLNGDLKAATLANYGRILRHQLNIEFSNRTAFSSPSKNSIISDCGQYFYREMFTKLFTPITRGYKIDEKQKRTSIYSFYSYAKWLYSFIKHRYVKKVRKQIFAIMKEFLGALHDFFTQDSHVSTTSIYIKETLLKADSSSQKRSEESAGVKRSLILSYYHPDSNRCSKHSDSEQLAI
jgi:hypothetical protein